MLPTGPWILRLFALRNHKTEKWKHNQVGSHSKRNLTAFGQEERKTRMAKTHHHVPGQTWITQSDDGVSNCPLKATTLHQNHHPDQALGMSWQLAQRTTERNSALLNVTNLIEKLTQMTTERNSALLSATNLADRSFAQMWEDLNSCRLEQFRLDVENAHLNNNVIIIALNLLGQSVDNGSFKCH
jgi:hypothetical protein